MQGTRRDTLPDLSRHGDALVTPSWAPEQKQGQGCWRGGPRPRTRTEGRGPEAGPEPRLCLPGSPAQVSGAPRGPQPHGGSTCEGQTHFIFSARCSVFSRMACDSWDTGFSIRLSKITWEDPGINTAHKCPGGPTHSLHPDTSQDPARLGSVAEGEPAPPPGSEASSWWPGRPPCCRSCSGQSLES